MSIVINICHAFGLAIMCIATVIVMAQIGCWIDEQIENRFND